MIELCCLIWQLHVLVSSSFLYLSLTTLLRFFFTFDRSLCLIKPELKIVSDFSTLCFLSHDHYFASMGYVNMEKRWVLFPLVITSLAFVFLLATSFNMGLISSLRKFNNIFSIIPSRHSHAKNQTKLDFAESKLARQRQTRPHEEDNNLPRFAYLVSGSKGDVEKLWRTLRAVYHPRNHYVVHLDLESPVDERLELASRINKDPMYSKTGNVYMITKANLVTYRGPTMVANTLHACAVLLKRSANWDWFINLSASDYPLVTQDGN